MLKHLLRSAAIAGVAFGGFAAHAEGLPPTLVTTA